MHKFILLFVLSPVFLSACQTAGAEPERYLSTPCSQLSKLQESYSQYSRNSDPFAASDYNFNKQFGALQRDESDIGTSRPGLTSYQVKQEKNLNSIRAAYTLKGC